MPVLNQLPAREIYNPVSLPTVSVLSVDALIQLPDFEAAVHTVADHYAFEQHPYLQWMQAPTTTRDAFRHSQLSFRFAVESFSQSLAAVLARILLLEDRLALAENVAEEHGHGDRLHAHKYTFRQYLLALGASPDELTNPCSIAVLAFNQSILNFCLTQSAEAGAAALGMIEHLYVPISAAIARTVHERGWTASGSQSHYTVHEVLDVEHARDLLAIAAPAWECKTSRLLVAQGLLLGSHYFWTLYHDLPRF
ncbi:iron-containing redox enzyme family protein [Oscillatoria sp. FACHB-1407]|uniref:iron-containing redox enzyme family protein n=1 Tax=Oscillatoria sp. FACHB-1407 TaxID=2692847 RepID=UPI0016844505|nr:iron-containing redox enzyme family protein [Oscillatoria sp. FACHB-1407]MBD2461088.1 iron-containing redox enzyme family protein [Oscillatoria sp. FACHB-1407]